MSPDLRSPSLVFTYSVSGRRKRKVKGSCHQQGEDVGWGRLRKHVYSTVTPFITCFVPFTSTTRSQPVSSGLGEEWWRGSDPSKTFRDLEKFRLKRLKTKSR